MLPALVCFLGVIRLAHGQSTISPLEANKTDHCIKELKSITATPIPLALSNPSKISPNYSVATSVSYHNASSTILIGGDFFYIDPKDTSNRTFYAFFQAFTHTNNTFTLKYSRAVPFVNPSFGNALISHKSLRSWTRIIAHPSLPYFFLLGINNLTAYHVANGDFLWTAKIPPCSSSTAARPIIYNTATFYPSDTSSIYVGGSCVDASGKTVVLLDEFSITSGAHNASFRQLYNLTTVGFFKDLSILDGFRLVPPEVTLAAPRNASLVITSTIDRVFYVGFTHAMFSGVARLERQRSNGLWRVETWPRHWTLVNPSFISHRNLVTTSDGLISLLDPSLKGLLNLFAGKMKHFVRWTTTNNQKKLSEKEQYATFTWYGGHEKYDLHLDWTLSAGADADNVFVLTAPLELPSVRQSTIAKHSVHTGEVIGGQRLPFYALDSIVTSEGQIIVVGFEWTPRIGDEELGIDILPFLERRAVFSVLANTATAGSCVGCEIDHYGSECTRRCVCNEAGYCDDGIHGAGDCYCTLVTYGTHCAGKCGITEGSCHPSKGICNAGPNGDGTCKFCYDAEVDVGNGSVDFNFSIGSYYGPQCDEPCSCETENGICYTTGDVSKPKAGQCLYCTRDGWYGEDCEKECECEEGKQYCDNGVGGRGCVDYDYGGLLTSEGWQFYAAIGVGLFVVFFSVTYWQANKHYREENEGRGLPWCPQREEQEVEKDDLKQRMIKERQQVNVGHGVHGVRGDKSVGAPDEPPMYSVVSRDVYSKDRSAMQDRQVPVPRQKYDI